MLIKFFDTGEIHPITGETETHYKFEKDGQIRSVPKTSDVFALLNEGSVLETFADIKVRDEIDSYEDAVEDAVEPVEVEVVPPKRKRSKKSVKETRDEEF